METVKTVRKDFKNIILDEINLIENKIMNNRSNRFSGFKIIFKNKRRML